MRLRGGEEEEMGQSPVTPLGKGNGEEQSQTGFTDGSCWAQGLAFELLC